MPSQATILARRAFEQLLARNGESVTLKRGIGAGATTATVKALIDRTGKLGLPRLNSEGNEPDGAVIQVLDSVTQPAAGNIFIDGAGISHRVIEVQPFGHCWNCTCSSQTA